MDDYVLNRYRVMRQLLYESHLKDKVVFDLGAGGHPISQGIDCRQKISLDIRSDVGPTVICNFVHSLPIKENEADVVVAGEILEHITNSRGFLREIKRVLVPGGILIVSTPNIVSLKYRLAFMIGKIPAHAAKADYTYSADGPTLNWGHVRDYSFGELRQVLSDQGFRVVAERSIGMHLAGKRVIPSWLMPVSFSDNVIVKAISCK